MTQQNQGSKHICWLSEERAQESSLIGGKNSSLAKMIGGLKDKGVRVPNGYASTAQAYWNFLEANKLNNDIRDMIERYRSGAIKLQEAGENIRSKIKKGQFSHEMNVEICAAFRALKDASEGKSFSVAVRSSATAEDLPEASFAGQLESFLNISSEERLMEVFKECFASLFTNRAISYREENKFDHLQIAVSVGVQEMVRSDKASAGVMFSLDTDTGFPGVILINSAWGLGEAVVQGMVNPDEFLVFKPLLYKETVNPVIKIELGSKEKKVVYSEHKGKETEIVDNRPEDAKKLSLSEDEAIKLAKWALEVERYYDRPMDMEWAKDGETGELYLVQARPETIYAQKMDKPFKHYSMKEKKKPILKGIAIGSAIGVGRAKILNSLDDMDRFEEGDVLIAKKTDPDWVPAMRMASAIVTEQGGRTSHAAIVSRELGKPAVIGTKGAKSTIKENSKITVSCAEGDDGNIYEGVLEFEEQTINPDQLPKTETNIMVNIASPGAAFNWWRLPTSGVGLARIEFLINTTIKVHPMALIHPEKVEDEKSKKQIEELTRGYEDKKQYFVDQLSRGMAQIAAAHYPNPVLIRFSDFKTNEYAELIGGKAFEPQEENPMLGFRGASRYTHENYREAFALECKALKKVRDVHGMENIIAMVPFCRTPEEADSVLNEMGRNGLFRGEKGLKVYVMAEIPSNIFLAKEFASRFDGFSIGSNDLTQLILGVDRDSEILSKVFNERHDSVKKAIRLLIKTAKEEGVKVGICGQAPSDYPDFAAFLVDEGIDSISLNPDSVIDTLPRHFRSGEEVKHKHYVYQRYEKGSVE
jgi:pyruvate, water dikinase